ncbi:hypothetical protein [Uliginosibacterium gangwonense]|uniref:hypothetical protein n=1 Tax=Uliginosibacterium gangwonense TaxID=392736 RepID=UPI000367BD5E|nr:hypothetical protein [Uliginosibacterium gangwonense]
MSQIRSSKGIYDLLEKHLRSAAYPMTCVNLMDIEEIRREALKEYGKDVRITTNKLSDLLGFMWRRGLLTRYPAPKDGDSLAKYAYIWDKQEDARPTPSPIPSPASSRRKTSVQIEEIPGGVVIEFDKFTITVKAK